MIMQCNKHVIRIGKKNMRMIIITCLNFCMMTLPPLKKHTRGVDEKTKTSEANFVDGTDIFSRNTLNRPRDFGVHAGCACVQSAVQGEYMGRCM